MAAGLQDQVAQTEPGSREGSSWRPSWTTLITIIALAIASYLLYRALRAYSLDQLVDSVSNFPLSRLFGAAAFAAASYTTLTINDYLALRYVGKPLPYPRAALVSFIGLSIGHTLGMAALSSGAIRYRFYSRWGLGPGDIAKVILFCAVTIALGLATLAGISLLIRSAQAAEATGMARITIIGIAVLCLSLSAGYLALAAFVRRKVTIRKWSLEPPRLPLAIAQVVVGTVNFAFVAACLHQTLLAVMDVPYFAVVSIYVTANTTGLLSHVPGGLGVLESVVLYLMPGDNVIVSLLVFRFIYYLVPLTIGGTVFAIVESTFRVRDRQRARGARQPAGTPG